MKAYGRYSIFYVTLILGLIVPSAVFPDASKKKVEGADTEQIVVKSDTLEMDNKRRIVTFTGNVDARKEDFIINCQKMVLYYNSRSSDRDPEKAETEIDKIIATGKVKITRPDGGLATAEQAIYYQRDEKIVLTGKPIIKHGNDFVEGHRIILFLKEERSIVEGSEGKKVKAVLFPKSENGN